MNINERVSWLVFDLNVFLLFCLLHFFFTTVANVYKMWTLAWVVSRFPGERAGNCLIESLCRLAQHKRLVKLWLWFLVTSVECQQWQQDLWRECHREPVPAYLICSLLNKNKGVARLFLQCKVFLSKAHVAHSSFWQVYIWLQEHLGFSWNLPESIQ